MHVCFGLIVALILFMAGIDSTSNRVGCGIIAVFIELSLLWAIMVSAFMTCYVV